MTTTLLLDDPAWSYPGGTCRLRVWNNDAPGEGYTLAVLTQPATAPGRSVTNAMDDIYPTLETRWGTGVIVVQQTQHPDGASEWEDIAEINGTYRWYPAQLDDLAWSIGVPATDLAGPR